LTQKSVFFPVSDLKLTCHLDLLYFMDANRKTGVTEDEEFIGDPVSVPGSYNCGADFVRIKPDGSVEIGFPGGKRMDTHPGAFVGSPTVLKICVTIGGSYTSRGFTRLVPTIGYQWPIAPGVPGWTREPIALDIDQTKWIPPNSQLGAAWSVSRGLIMLGPDGKRQLDPEALRCGQRNAAEDYHRPLVPLARIRRSDGQEGDLWSNGLVYPPGSAPPGMKPP
jgi:hypothetical protein